MNNLLTIITQKKQQLDLAGPLPPELIKNLDEWYKVELTYTSNAIEGNTLSRAETALVIEKGITVEGKTIKEHLEAINHARSFEFIKSLTAKKREKLTESDILDIHRIILSKIDEANAGRYRSVPVRIAGSNVIMPNPLKVTELMNKFIVFINSVKEIHPVTMASKAHYKLVSIHPFVDGNGRTARLLMNLLLMQQGYPPAVIRKEDRQRYINSIEKAQLGGSLDDFFTLMEKAVERSLDIYLEGAKGTQGKSAAGRLLKIGELAKQTQETVPTLRFWTREGTVS